MEINNTAPKYCKFCTAEIHPQRLKALPNTSTCVSCSNVKTKKPITLQQGEGDHTYTETIIVDSDTYDQYIKTEAASRKLFGYNLIESTREVSEEEDTNIQIDPNKVEEE